ncbi:MAG: hypothetical protein JXQ72_08920 [Anaerolineae bacterium]|nr:hypothetical protein [Anaerolineae bacterium]
MRVVINQAKIDRNRRFSHILFFVSLAGMGVGFFYTWTQPSNSSQMSCMLLPILLIMTLTSVRMANTWIREPRPVDALAESFKGLGQKYTVFHYLLPAPHVLIGPEGVFCIHPVWQDRKYRVSGKKWYGDEGMVRKLNGYMRQDLLGNPFAEAQYQAQQFQRMVDKIAPDQGVEVQPLIVFIHPNANIEIEDPLFPVLFADTKRKPALRDYIRDQKDAGRATLTPENLDKLDHLYGLVTRQELEEWETGDVAGDGEDDTENIADDTGEADAMSADDLGGDSGPIYVLQAGQLFYIGAGSDSAESKIESLKGDVSQTIELIHTIQAEDAEAMEAYLHKKFARKRQKGNWYGLSQKDVAWLKSRKGELN